MSSLSQNVEQKNKKFQNKQIQSLREDKQNKIIQSEQQQQFQTYLLDRKYIHKIQQSTKTLLGIDKSQWHCEQIFRFLTLLKIQSKLQIFFYQFKITGQLLFNLKYLWEMLQKYIQPRTYFPIMKLIYVINGINQLDKKSREFKYNSKSEGKLYRLRFLVSNINPNYNNTNNSNKKLSKGKDQNYYAKTINFDFNSKSYETQNYYDSNSLPFISLQPQLLSLLQKQFSSLGQFSILELSSNNLIKIFKATAHSLGIQISQIIKKYSLDAYCLLCLFAEKQIYLQQIQIFFSHQEINKFQEILNYLIGFYYRQQTSLKQNKNKNVFDDKKIMSLKGNAAQINFQFVQKNTNIFQLEETNYKFSSNSQSGQLGTSEYGGSSQIQQQGEGISQIQKSEFGVSQQQQGSSLKRSQLGNSIARSEYGQSQYGQSEYGKSEYGQSEYRKSQYGNSQYGMSQQGSVRGSLAQSYFGQSITEDSNLQKNNKYNNTKNEDANKGKRVSSIQDRNIIDRLKQAALTLPFNLFKMNPLQTIKITSLSYPFTLDFPKPKKHQQFIKNLKLSLQKLTPSTPSISASKQFNITGVKFGRSQQNDFRYPDQLSISGKHAQIGFWDNKYQLMDLQSKTGTFLYIPYTRPLILKDQMIIQLSNQIEIIVHILKKEQGQGLIKLQFSKPQNQPFYKASLKQNQILKIGRSQKSHIKLQQQSISSKHTQIKYQNKQFKIYDCISSTGTWLRLSKKGIKSQLFQLAQGDIIRISSKKTYLIQKMTNSLQQNTQNQCEQDYDQYESLIQNPNFKLLRQNSQDKFNQIIHNAMKRKDKIKEQNSLNMINLVNNTTENLSSVNKNIIKLSQF